MKQKMARLYMLQQEYKLNFTTVQRKYGGPPPDWEGDPPASGCEVSSFFFCMNYNRMVVFLQLIALYQRDK